MDFFEYALRAYNLLLDLVLLILSPFVGPLRYLAIGGVYCWSSCSAGCLV